MGRLELASDPRFATSVSRLENHRALNEYVDAWASGRTAAEIENILVDGGIAAGRLIGISEIAADANIRHRASVRLIKDRLENKLVLRSSSPIRATPVSCRSAEFVPSRGEDNAPIRQVERKVKSDDRTRAYRKPYDGVRIVEIGQNTVAPLAARLFGALGAPNSATRLTWVQKEPENMGAWSWIRPRLKSVARKVGHSGHIHYCGRPEAASPAGSFHGNHEVDQRSIVSNAFSG